MSGQQVLAAIASKHNRLFEEDCCQLAQACKENNCKLMRTFETTWDVSALRQRPQLVFYAAENGSLTALEILVGEWGLPSDRKHFGKTPLEAADEKHMVDVVKYLQESEGTKSADVTSAP